VSDPDRPRTSHSLKSDFTDVHTKENRWHVDESQKNLPRFPDACGSFYKITTAPLAHTGSSYCKSPKREHRDGDLAIHWTIAFEPAFIALSRNLRLNTSDIDGEGLTDVQRQGW
jgi:hypothetical protein